MNMNIEPTTAFLFIGADIKNNGVSIIHDDDCGFFLDGDCTCKPAIEAEPVTPRVLKRWAKEDQRTKRFMAKKQAEARKAKRRMQRAQRRKNRRK